MNKNKEIYDNSIKNIELIDSNIICYIGSENNRKKSVELCKEIKIIPDEDIIFENGMTSKYFYGENQYIYYYTPLFEKSIKIYNSIGKQFKAVICFTEDIKNILAYFKMKNPHYLEKSTNKYLSLSSDDDYAMFLLGDNEIIKDISYSSVNYKNLKKLYKNKKEKFKLKKANKALYLKEINDNLYNYSKINNLKDEKIFYTKERAQLFVKLDTFFKKDKKILGIYGNYSSGKSISLIMYNYYSVYPTLYLNLKALKNSFQTKGFTKLLPNEAINIYIKNNKSFKNYKNFIKKTYKSTYNSFESFVVSLIKHFINWKAIIFLDQYNHDLFNTEFINKLQKIYSENVNIKILLINSMNDKWIRKIYINSILNYFKGITKIENIEFIFLNK